MNGGLPFKLGLFEDGLMLLKSPSARVTEGDKIYKLRKI